MNLPFEKAFLPVVTTMGVTHSIEKKKRKKKGEREKKKSIMINCPHAMTPFVAKPRGWRWFLFLLVGGSHDLCRLLSLQEFSQCET